MPDPRPIRSGVRVQVIRTLGNRTHMAPYVGQEGRVVEAGMNLLPGFVAVAIESGPGAQITNPIPTIFHNEELQEAPQERTNHD